MSFGFAASTPSSSTELLRSELLSDADEATAHGAALFVDPRARRLIDQLRRIAPSDASILIVGETGTGKEVMAREVHARSGRPGPFVAVNCGALTENLGEAALFGHEAGAYTGAGPARAGWFEAANGGTLFLDEIGDLPLSLQVALLRVLQERKVVRLGSRKAIPVDVRIIAATNVDVSKAVSSGKFRLDLYFRVGVVTLDLPPLRQRLADILPLAERFIRIYSSKLDLDPPQLDIAAEHAILNYPWPGNIRELENVMHGAVLTCVDGVIRPHDLRLAHWAATSEAEVAPASEQAQLSINQVDDLTAAIDALLAARPQQLMENLELLVIRRALLRCNNNQVQTARLLGITRNVLRTYLKRFQLLGSEQNVDIDAADASALSARAPLDRFAREAVALGAA
jgi:sigma-54-specific transcriptional regulator